MSIPQSLSGVTCPWLCHALLKSALWNGAGEGIRTPGLNRGMVALYQTELFPHGATHTGIAREGAIPIQAAPDKTYPNCERTCVWSGLPGDGLKLKGLNCFNSSTPMAQTTKRLGVLSNIRAFAGLTVWSVGGSDPSRLGVTPSDVVCKRAI